MSEVQADAVTSQTDVANDTPVAVAPATAGGVLRRAREEQGLHIAALAVSLKVPVRKLEALEADRLDLLTDAVFVRALAASVCRTLKIDPASVLALLPQTSTPRLDRHQDGINAPFRSPGDGPGPSMWTQVSRPAVLAVLALLLGAIVLIFLPGVRQDDASASRATDAVGMAGPVPAVMTTSSPAETDAAVPTRSDASAAQANLTTVVASAVPATSPTVSVSVALSTPTVASPTLVITAPAPLPPPSAPSPTDGVVVFTTLGPSWIEVVDAKGVISLRRIVTPGETVGASGALPLSVTVGRADSTQVQVRGRRFDLAGLARDNVARFEVK